LARENICYPEKKYPGIIFTKKCVRAEKSATGHMKGLQITARIIFGEFIRCNNIVKD
jgi:hypothetical protein